MASTPARYSLYNSESTKQLSLAVQIDGLSDVLANRKLYTRLLYGDPGVKYGDPELVYGGLRPMSNVRDILSLDGSSLSISQKIEPESGKSSISQLTLAFIDQGAYMTQLISPGVLLDEILGREVKVYLGYKEISFPEDYARIFRGYVSGVSSQSGIVTLSLSDPNIKKRQNLFFTAKTSLTSGILAGTTGLALAATGDFHQQIQGPSGTYDSAVSTYIKIEDEFMSYDHAGITSPTAIAVTRGQRTTTAVSHNSGSDVSAAVQIDDHAVDMALKLMLSGWNGPWITGVTVSSFGQTTDPLIGIIPGAIVLPDKTDANADYGLTEGDYVTISGGANNGVTAKITGFKDLFGISSRIIITDASFTTEYPSVGTASFRSQYDTYPVSCGLKMTPQDVDVEAHKDLKRNFLGQNENSYQFLITDQEGGKDFIEDQILKPLGCYSLTRGGRISVGITKPPLPGVNLVYLTADNIIDPQNIAVTRATNDRKFFNQLNFEYNHTDSGAATSILKILDSESLSKIGISSELTITARGGRTSKGIETVFNRRSKLMLQRYKRGAAQIPLTVNWEAGSQIEAGDIVAVMDDGALQISNFSTGARDLEVTLFEVLDRTLDFKSGNCKLKLVAGVGSVKDDRFGTIAPSSKLDSGSTSAALILKDSFGAIFPGQEYRKWQDYVGLKILVHDYAYATTGETVITGFDSSNPNKMLVSPALGFTPAADYIVDLANYPNNTDANDQKLAKLMHAYFTPQVAVTGGTDQTHFTVGAGDAGKFLVGDHLVVHSVDWSSESVETTVKSVAGTTIETNDALGFTPTSAMKVDLIGFPDGGQPYRLI